MKVIVPCCGRSSRYPDCPPKWMLPAHDGQPMLALAVAGLSAMRSDLVVTILREHEERYHVSEGLRSVFRDGLDLVILDKPTRSQAETVLRTLQRLDGDEPFLVKDSDNTFLLDDIAQPHNYVCADSLNNHDLINPRNKSYLQVDRKGLITNIREKVVISDLFSVGGYFFTSPEQFNEYYEKLAKHDSAWNGEMYLSDVIGAMILDGIPFHARHIEGYEDWGTIHEWQRKMMARRAFFVSLDGFLFERGSEYFRPRFSEVKPMPRAVEAVRALQRRNHSIFYVSIRPAHLADLTKEQIEAAGLPAGKVIFGCPVSPWTMLSAPHPTLPFRTSAAQELAADDPNLFEKIAEA